MSYLACRSWPGLHHQTLAQAVLDTRVEIALNEILSVQQAGCHKTSHHEHSDKTVKLIPKYMIAHIVFGL